MNNPFLTLEDINGCLYSNQGFWWYELDTANITEDNDFSNIRYDFVTVSRETESTKYKYTFTVDNAYWTKGVQVNEDLYAGMQISGNTLTIRMPLTEPSMKLQLYMGFNTFDDVELMLYQLTSDEKLNLNYNELNTAQTVTYKRVKTGATFSQSVTLQKGYNLIDYQDIPIGYVFVNLIKSDFQFNCNQNLTVGKINKVALGTDTDYKPSGAMIGTYTPTITVEYNNKIIPVTYDSTLEDYVFNLDLTDKTNEGNIKFKVIIEDNEVINRSETNVKLTASFEEINTLSKLTSLFSNGGIGRLTTNLTLTNDLIVTDKVYLTTVDKTLTMDSHKIIVGSDKTFKAENITFTGGQNTIQQKQGSKVELIGCTFTSCTGLGSVIDCQVDVQSLDDPTDFNTILTNCIISNCNNPAILSGGELTVTSADVTGKIDNPNYPYFLYQTDGEAVILDSKFKLESQSSITSDIEFNSAIFTCGENAQVNGYSHTELQSNNLTGFLATQRNTSQINVTYKYGLIDDYIKLETLNGFCHSVSGVDYVFKTNVILTRL